MRNPSQRRLESPITLPTALSFQRKPAYRQAGWNLSILNLMTLDAAVGFIHLMFIILMEFMVSLWSVWFF